MAPKSEGGHYTNLAHKALGFSSVGNWLHLCTLFLKILFMLYIYSPLFQTKLLVVLVCETSLGRKIRGI